MLKNLPQVVEEALYKNLPPICDKHDLIKILKISKRTVDRIIYVLKKQGKVIKEDNNCCFSRSDLIQFIDELQVKKWRDFALYN